MPSLPELEPSQTSYLAYMMNDFILWHLCRVRERFEGDLECAVILGEIAHYNVQQAFLLHPERALGPNAVVDSLKSTATLKSCNAFSISAATGIPRETVRRKIQWLEQRGWIVKDAKGRWVVTPAPAQEFMEFNRESLERFLNAADRSRWILERFSRSAAEVPAV